MSKFVSLTIILCFPNQLPIFYTISEPIDYEISNKYYSAVVRLCIATSVDKIASQDRELLNGIILVVLSDEKVF